METGGGSELVAWASAAAIIALAGLVALLPFWVTFRKAGLSPWVSLLVLVPYLGAPIVFVVLAFSRWPATED
jgi:hypothetical protein